MANCTVTIEYLGDGNGGTITSFTNARGEVLDIPTSPSFGGNYFILGVSELGGTDVLGDFGGWIGSENSSVTGVLSNTEININGTNLDHFTLYFDSVAKQWATLISIDGTQYENNDAIFYWEGASADTHKVQLLRWNTPHYPARLTGISTGVSRTYYRTEIKSITRGSELFSDAQQPSYGVLPQYGSIELYDTDGEILYYAQNKMLDKGQKVTIKLDDNIIGKYITDEWDYQYGKNVVKITLQDDLSFLDREYYTGYNYEDNGNALMIFEDICRSLNIVANISAETKEYLSSIYYTERWLSSGDARTALNNFCKATMTYFVITGNGDKSLFSEKELRTVKYIYPNSIIGSPKSQLVVDNIIDGVEITEYELERVENTIDNAITSVVEFKNNLYATITNRYGKTTGEQEECYFATSKDGSSWNKLSCTLEANDYFKEFRNLRNMKVFGDVVFALCDYSANLYDTTIRQSFIDATRKKSNCTALIYSNDMKKWSAVKGTYGVEVKNSPYMQPDEHQKWSSAHTFSVFNVEDYFVTSDGQMYAVGYNYCTNYQYYDIQTIPVVGAIGAVLCGEMVGDWVKKSNSYTTPNFEDGASFSNGCNNPYYTGSISSFETFCLENYNNHYIVVVEEITPASDKSSRCYFGTRHSYGGDEYGNALNYSSKKSSDNLMCNSVGDMAYFITRDNIYSARKEIKFSPIFQNTNNLPLLNATIWDFCTDENGKYYVSYASDISNYILRFNANYAVVGENDYVLYYSEVANNSVNNYGYGLYFLAETPQKYPQIVIYPKTPIDKGLTFLEDNVYNRAIRRMPISNSAIDYAPIIYEFKNEVFSALQYVAGLNTLFIYSPKTIIQTDGQGGTTKFVVTLIVSSYGMGEGKKTKVVETKSELFFGSDKNIYSVDDNEMIRSSATINSEQLVDYIANKILNDRQNGLQSVEINCNVRNYDDLLAMTDIVIPYIRNNVPFAKYKNGDPKKFLVYSVEYNYNGTHKQNLKMLEVRLNG